MFKGNSGWTAVRLIVSASLFSYLFQTPSLALSSQKSCYTGNGTLSTDIPCNPSADASFCCGDGWSCLSNGLCQFRDSTSFAEGTCTDKTYPINACLGTCLASGNEDQTLVHNCGGSGAGDTNSWCCAGVQGTTGKGQDCCSSDATTTLKSFPYSTIAVIKALSTPSKAVSSSSSSLSSSAQLSSTQSASARVSSSTTPQLPVSARSTSTSIPVTSPTEGPTAAATPATRPPDSRNIAIGAGVGVPLGIIALAATIALLFRDRKVKKQIRQLQENIERSNEKPIAEALNYESENSVQREYELETGIDRAELRAGYTHHEAPDRQLHELR